MIQTATKESRLTNSRIRCAQTCLKKHHLSYELGVRKDVDSLPLRLGSAFHEGLDIHKKGDSPQAAIDKAIEDFNNSTPVTNDADRAYQRAIEGEKVTQLLNGYFWRWEDMDKDIEIIASELSFEIPITNPASGRTSRTFTLAGKIDAIVRLADGRLAVLEHKTTSDDISPDSDYWAKLRIDSQISLYYMAAKALGYDVETVLYDVTRKPSIRPKNIPSLDKDGFKQIFDANGERVYKKDGTPRQTASTKDGFELLSRPETPAEYGERLRLDIGEQYDRYYRRQEITRLNIDLEDAAYELWEIARLIADCQKNNRWPRSCAACIGYYKCEYFDICTNGIDPLEQMPEGFKQVEDVHQEL